MLAFHEEFSRAARDQLSWQLDAGSVLGDTLVQGLRQYAELNLGMLRLTLEQGNLAARQLASVRDARQLMSLAQAQLAPNAARGFDYGYYAATIAAGMQSGAIRAFAGVPENGREWEALAARLQDPFGFAAAFSFLRGIAESAFRAWRMPADVARAVRLAVNLNTPAEETGKLHIAYPVSGPGRGRE
ncbi:phasin family protein [Noviherbaspirillum sp.]|uniref:phasin family protein n=1 Tax=Noviherbaspirillum sp. TaxID=1926288 RepID=UPI002D30B876|nr:phasin family protein [Noviherbaspirillum sp.]HZW19901.1 phasin family protein [Noviherbaspirillum sp.]